MASLKEIRTRIKSIDNTAKITHAMELVAAAKMKSSQELAVSGKPYSELVNSTIRSIASKTDIDAHPLLAREPSDKSLIVYFSTDRGLAGALNSNLVRELETTVGKISFITIGKKGRSFVAKTGKDLVADFPLPEKPEVASVRPISKLIIKSFLSNDIGQVHILFTKFVSTLKQTAVLRQLLPIVNKVILDELAMEESQKYSLEPKFEPNPDVVLETILPQYILMELYQTLLEAKASEHSARMVSMKNATDNANQLVDDLNLTYNGVRQEAITKEILDITTAAIALE